MQLVFVDDAKQDRPTRPGMGPLVAAGAVMVDADVASAAEKDIESACVASGFPRAEEFKWSPGRECWMRDNLVGNDRQRFLLGVIEILKGHGALAHVVIEDSSKGRATSGCETAESDVTVLLLERLANRLKAARTTALLVADRPGGARPQEDLFILDTLKALEAGTQWVQHEEISFVIATDSRFVRLLQVADLVTSCMTAYVAGEPTYAPPIAQAALPLFPSDYNRRGGYSIKIHPDFRYGNLYHWLLGDSHFVRYQSGYPMPLDTQAYGQGPDEP